MDRVVNFLTSRQLMGALFIFLAVVLAVATFLENDFGYNAARALVYNTWWFELIFLLLAINMFGNLFAFNLWRWSKFPVLLFHLSFFIIIVGAAITRYVGFEGSMPIREGEISDTYYSLEGYVTVEVADQGGTDVIHEQVFLSPRTPREFSESVEINNQTYKIESVSYVQNAAVRPVEKPGGQPLAGILFSSSVGRTEQFLAPGERINRQGVIFAFEPNDPAGVDFIIRRHGEAGIVLQSRKTLEKSSMTSGTQESVAPGTIVEMQPGILFSWDEVKFALSRFWPEAVLGPVSVPGQGGSGLSDVVSFRISGDEKSYDLHVTGEKGVFGEPNTLSLPDGKISVRYGSLPLQLPFAIRLNDFQLERYPGSESPSSYASEVTLIDQREDLKMDYRIFMNNILNYEGYRFYQSSYDRDEKGTILSVNRDFLGTVITYLGYILMSVSMFWSLFASKTRFRQLLQKTNTIYQKRKSLGILLLFIFSTTAFSQEMPPRPDEDIAGKLGQLWVQDKGGRIKPLNSLHQEIMVKLVKHNSFNGFNPDQMLLGMFTHPAEWQQVPLITVKHPHLKEMLGVSGKKAAFSDFFGSDRRYKIKEMVDAAYRNNPANRDKLEQELIKVDEQVNVFYMAQSGELHRMFPVNNERSNPWLIPSKAPEGLSAKDSLFVASAMPAFIVSLRENNNEKALSVLEDMSEFQSVHGGRLLPSETIRDAEILYNRLNIFMWLATFFFVLGIILVLYNILGLVYPPFSKRVVETASLWIIGAGFLYHSFGMVLRWYVSGHAPWSNGYESMIFIAWALLLAGLLFSRRSPLVLSVTALFAGVVLMVSHLSWMNPEITNLVPVLKSYWLTLHVAVIIGGYGFMTLGALLGFMNLLLTTLQTKENKSRISLAIDELTAINEMALIVGLYLMTIGSFLGGVWANESWGRYWGWDPKETWSLITILIYAFVVHMRLIPGLRGRMAFNTAALLSFGSVIMTYLGVNYYLTGMHSYAGGDPVPIPSAVYYAVVIIGVLIGSAFWKNRKMKVN
ncbi:cytochrome c-type biogenesis protein CcsB [Marinilabilia salmonicolor]|jgi:cytochrome c-type biogenesis protein CcsB|uniref:c-type cytochrome biogenesis protein CcsB n=1 Tax=Marinilabilia salmonicolor TaxID=989 RepID=UPI000D04D9E2|nr:c-type cytochrome biogenesis protein CcsB [Marinilabilia salmonicolor]PRZ01775.1 cytochrome c-type biogenesis protein CcsB [Marinilabilia salmonicolor]